MLPTRFHRSLLWLAFLGAFLSGLALGGVVQGQELQSIQIAPEDWTLTIDGSQIPIGRPYIKAIREPRFDWNPALVYALSRIPDEWSTHRFLHNGSGCTEGTAAWLIGPHPSDAKIALSSLAADAAFAGYTYGLYRLGKALHHEAAFRRLTWGVTGALAGMEVGSAMRNVRMCP